MKDSISIRQLDNYFRNILHLSRTNTGKRLTLINEIDIDGHLFSRFEVRSNTNGNTSSNKCHGIFKSLEEALEVYNSI